MMKKLWSAIRHLQHEPSAYVHHCYGKSSYLAAYGQMMQPLNGLKFQEKRGIDPPQPPPYKVIPCRPAKNRRKEVGEPGSGHKL